MEALPQRTTYREQLRATGLALQRALHCSAGTSPKAARPLGGGAPSPSAQYTDASTRRFDGRPPAGRDFARNGAGGGGGGASPYGDETPSAAFLTPTGHEAQSTVLAGQWAPPTYAQRGPGCLLGGYWNGGSPDMGTPYLSPACSPMHRGPPVGIPVHTPAAVLNPLLPPNPPPSVPPGSGDDLLAMATQGSEHDKAHIAAQLRAAVPIYYED